MMTFEIDLSSDTATKPTEAMRRYMCAAPVGDEQRMEDPTVLELEGIVAELTGKEAAVFLPSGTMCNIISLFLHCSPGDEVILHRWSHPVYSENAGPAVHSRVALHLLDGDRGVFTGMQVAEAVLPDLPQKARTHLVCVENTNNRAGGTIWRLAEIEDVTSTARSLGLRTHLDGARLLNAVVATEVSAAQYCAPFDSVWIDLSKGLGCPMGAVLAGLAEFAREARWAKHLFGGAMRQAGIIAAAGVYALRNHVDRLVEDHERAQELARGLKEVTGIKLTQAQVETNIVHFDIAATGIGAGEFLRRLEPFGIRFGIVEGSILRAVTHLDILPEHITRAVMAVRQAARTGFIGSPASSH